jgi:hypothetical protein
MRLPTKKVKYSRDIVGLAIMAIDTYSLKMCFPGGRIHSCQILQPDFRSMSRHEYVSNLFDDLLMGRMGTKFSFIDVVYEIEDLSVS